MDLTPYSQIDMNQLKMYKNKITRFLMAYKFAIDEMDTKIKILQEEFEYIHDYNPIEHTKSRLKAPESILNKVMRKGGPISFANVKENLRDIAGIRITCSFRSDIYQISDMLQKQRDLKLIEIKDYIKDPKDNGYQSLHLIFEIPIYMSDREERVYVEVQIRTIAMDFWASLEHKIFYKYNQGVPERLLKELKDAAETAATLDRKMEELHNEVNEMKDVTNTDTIDDHAQLPLTLLKSLQIDEQ
ncbi:GTP pyrophosphokinase [Bacillus solitudinis]|uniref:GTP pyrophosphokinase n=1 Tax=Bacillus solitudinis TaxID=2014074 RepID=UPI000C23607B|nr:GTP pyrophosphokinase family protein [Bacillus solitudinis]